MRSTGFEYEEAGEVRTVTDNKGQEIRLQKVHVNGLDDNVLLVDSDAKALKEASMDSKASSRYEEGLDAIKKGIEGKGTKKRDKVNRRLGRLNQRCPGLEKRYTIEFTYNDKDVATAMTWRRNQNACAATKKMHGKYFLQTSLDENREENIWQFYNVIRTVEETFKTLKLDLDIRPIYHKSDKGTKSHLHLAILAYWVVSVTKYMLKKKGIKHALVGAAAHHERPAARHHRGGADRADDNSGCGDARPRRRSSRPSRTPSASLPNLPAQ